MNNMPWKPKKLIGDECTVFYQHAISCTTSHVNKDINSHRNNAEGHQFNITNHQNTVTKSPAGSDRESSRCQIVDVSCESCQNGYPVRIIVALLIARVPHIQAFEPWPVMQPTPKPLARGVVSATRLPSPMPVCLAGNEWCPECGSKNIGS